MAKYKNWYLAGESGMKDERKKLKLIILQCIAVITANFITIWYFEELFFRGFWYVIFASFLLNHICLFDYLFISSQMSAKPYFIGSTGILLLW